MKFWRATVVLVSLMLSIIIGTSSAQSSYTVTVNTASLAGTTGSLDLNFNPGPLVTQAASVQVSGVATDGKLVGTPILTGDVTGTLPSASFDNEMALNDYFQAFTFGSSLSFTISFFGPALSAPNGTATSGTTFAFSVFSDAGGTQPALTTDSLTGFALLANVNLDGTITIVNNIISGGMLISPSVTVTPSTGSITVAQMVNISTVVNGGVGNVIPTGSVIVASGSYTSAPAILTNGTATIAVPPDSLPIGSDVLTASYSGDVSFAKAIGSTVLVVTQLTPTVILTPNAQSVTTTQSVSIVASASGGSGNPVPTGSVTLSSGSYSSAVTALSNGSATITLSPGSLPVGVDILTGSYSGDHNYSQSAGTTQITVVTPPVPSFTVAGTGVTVTRGATTGNTSTIIVTPTGGFMGNVTLASSVASSPTGAQNLPTLSFGATSPLNIAGSTAGFATLTVSTTAATGTKLDRLDSNPSSFSLALAGANVVALTFGLASGRRRRWARLLRVILVLVLTNIGLSGCGSHSPPGTVNAGTSPGTYLVTVTANSGSTSVSNTISVQVQ